MIVPIEEQKPREKMLVTEKDAEKDAESLCESERERCIERERERERLRERGKGRKQRRQMFCSIPCFHKGRHTCMSQQKGKESCAQLIITR